MGLGGGDFFQQKKGEREKKVGEPDDGDTKRYGRGWKVAQAPTRKKRAVGMNVEGTKKMARIGSRGKKRSRERINSVARRAKAKG